MLPGFKSHHEYILPGNINIEENVKHLGANPNPKILKSNCQHDELECKAYSSNNCESSSSQILFKITPLLQSTSVTVKALDYEGILVERFAHLFTQSGSKDVSIMCGKNRDVLRAHKYVLSFGCLYFREALKVVICRHPVITLTNIPVDIMKRVLEYMYFGQVTLKSESELGTFMRSAKYLMVTGIQDEHYKTKN